MSSLTIYRRVVLARNFSARTLTTTTTTTTTSSSEPSPSSPPLPETWTPPLTHFKITLRRSAISLGDKTKGTLEALGIHKRNQTVYHRHSPDIAGKILAVKELVDVENVPSSAVRNQWEQRQERRAVRGYKVVGNKRDVFMHV
ncbi:54S ribosomal protein L33, mitochondrial [Leucoagaricus sp. SymC.cos]|nr:54S ribosomal protein L33, mitochondrial [Leucoagaricus sp. SymC.cos]